MVRCRTQITPFHTVRRSVGSKKSPADVLLRMATPDHGLEKHSDPSQLHDDDRLCLREDRIYKKRVGKRIDRDYVDCHRTSDLLCRDKSIQHSAMTRVAGFGIVSWIRTDYVRDIERSSKQTSVMLPPFPESISFKIDTRKLRFQTDLLILCCQSSPYLTK